LTFCPERSRRERSQKLSGQNQQNARVSKNLPSEISNHELNTLDLTIDRREKNFHKNGELDTKTYFKPTETFQYIQALSAHPSFCLKGFVKGETLRHKRNYNNALPLLKLPLFSINT
jgi:hypothetical protein